MRLEIIRPIGGPKNSLFRMVGISWSGQAADNRCCETAAIKERTAKTKM